LFSLAYFNLKRDGHALPYKSCSDITILIIDDDKAISDSLVQSLTGSGYSAVCAYTGEQGLALVQHRQPHVALVDLKLPDINGIKLIKSIKSASPGTIIILISGYATIDAAAESIKSGADDFIAKPFNFGELEQILCRAIEYKNRQEQYTRLKKRILILALALALPFSVLIACLIRSYLK
jgi:DNA-binding NtrC family response regulator